MTFTSDSFALDLVAGAALGGLEGSAFGSELSMAVLPASSVPSTGIPFVGDDAEDGVGDAAEGTNKMFSGFRSQ